jgi:hypothetical protein
MIGERQPRFPAALRWHESASALPRCHDRTTRVVIQETSTVKADAEIAPENRSTLPPHIRPQWDFRAGRRCPSAP